MCRVWMDGCPMTAAARGGVGDHRQTNRHPLYTQRHRHKTSPVLVQMHDDPRPPALLLPFPLPPRADADFARLSHLPHPVGLAVLFRCVVMCCFVGGVCRRVDANRRPSSIIRPIPYTYIHNRAIQIQRQRRRQRTDGPDLHHVAEALQDSLDLELLQALLTVAGQGRVVVEVVLCMCVCVVCVCVCVCV
jgi:hypothetical protein